MKNQIAANKIIADFVFRFTYFLCVIGLLYTQSRRILINDVT